MFHKDNPRYAESLLCEKAQIETPWTQRWEREFRHARWVERNGSFLPAPGWVPVGMPVMHEPRKPATYANRNKR